MGKNTNSRKTRNRTLIVSGLAVGVLACAGADTTNTEAQKAPQVTNDPQLNFDLNTAGSGSAGSGSADPCGGSGQFCCQDSSGKAYCKDSSGKSTACPASQLC